MNVLNILLKLKRSLHECGLALIGLRNIASVRKSVEETFVIKNSWFFSMAC